LPLNVQC